MSTTNPNPSQSTEIVPAEVQGEIVPIEPGRVIEIKNLVVSPMPRLDLALGTTDSFVRVVEDMTNVRAVVWNEHRICLLTDDRNTSITFEPELRPEAAMFFDRDRSGEKRDDGSVLRVWEGEYAPVKFSKKDLVAFINKYSAVIDGGKELTDAVKKMNVKQLVQEQAEMLDLDSDNSRTTIEETTTSNVPKAFKLRMNLAENITGELQFQVGLSQNEDRYGNKKPGYQLVLRCVNGREVMQSVMQLIVNKLPQHIPRYYGAMRLGDGGKKGGVW